MVRCIKTFLALFDLRTLAVPLVFIGQLPILFNKQKDIMNETANNTYQEWHASIRERIINQLLKINPPNLPAKAKLQTISAVQLALWAFPTLTDDDPTGVIEGTASTDPTTMADLVSSLQSTEPTTYYKKEILTHLRARQDKLNDNFEQRAMKYNEEFFLVGVPAS